MHWLQIVDNKLTIVLCVPSGKHSSYLYLSVDYCDVVYNVQTISMCIRPNPNRTDTHKCVYVVLLSHGHFSPSPYMQIHFVYVLPLSSSIITITIIIRSRRYCATYTIVAIYNVMINNSKSPIPIEYAM